VSAPWRAEAEALCADRHGLAPCPACLAEAQARVERDWALAAEGDEAASARCRARLDLGRRALGLARGDEPSGG
jgi:hypothetical protein